MSRVDSQTVSLHYVTSYADGDRIDLSSYEDNPLFFNTASVLPHRPTVLPSSNDLDAITGNIDPFMARIFICYTPYSFPALE